MTGPMTTDDPWDQMCGGTQEEADHAAIARRVLTPCGDIVADGCEVYDPACAACVQANSDAPEWTL